MRRVRRRGLTLIELLVVAAMIGIVAALLLPAVQKVRQASKREACAEKLMQIGLALYSYHDTYNVLPPGLESTDYPTNVYWFWSWMGRILPYIGEEDLWRQADDYARTVNVNPWSGNPALSTPLDVWQCPADDRVLVATFHSGQGGPDLTVAFTDYIGVSGTNSFSFGGRGREGVLFENSRVRFADITNGLSNVLMVGERPPTADLLYGWWFAGAGQASAGATTGSADVVLGVLEPDFVYNDCPREDNHFMVGDLGNKCDQFHYWSLHRHGANFLLADGSAHFFKYTVDPAIIIAMAYRSGGPP